METFIVSGEAEAVSFCLRYKPRRCVRFKKPSGLVVAAWIVVAGIGELYTHKSLKQKVRKTYLLAYDFYKKTFSGGSCEEKNARP